MAGTPSQKRSPLTTFWATVQTPHNATHQIQSETDGRNNSANSCPPEAQRLKAATGPPGIVPPNTPGATTSLMAPGVHPGPMFGANAGDVT